MTVGVAGRQSFVERMIGAARLDEHTYEEVEHDRDATMQAALVVVIAAIASGIGLIGENGIAGLIFGIAGALVGWAVFAWVTYFVGTNFFATESTSANWGELARALGFAYTPEFLLVLGFIPVLGAIIAVIVFVWVLIATIVALRAALDFTTGRAIGTAVVAWIALIVVNAIFFAIAAAIS